MGNGHPIYLFILIAFAFTASLSFLYLNTVRNRPSRAEGDIYNPEPAEFLDPLDAASNATLGFQKIFTLSSGTPWRIQHMQAAANLTGLKIEAPAHINAPDALVEAYQGIGGEGAIHPNKGAARAWLAHLDLLRYVDAAGFGSALILEDDVDWDVAVKEQTRLIAAAVRQFTSVSPNETAPYGNNWDILWLGHCGEAMHKKEDRLDFNDTTTGRPKPSDGYNGMDDDGRQFLEDGHRAVQYAQLPVCSFAYAVNSRNVEKVLRRTSRGADQAFDIVLDNSCRNRDLDCVIVNPEIMHQYDPPESGSSEVERVNGDHGVLDPEELELALETHMGVTEGIANSARCKAVFNATCSERPPAPPSPPPIPEETEDGSSLGDLTMTQHGLTSEHGIIYDSGTPPESGTLGEHDNVSDDSTISDYDITSEDDTTSEDDATEDDDTDLEADAAQDDEITADDDYIAEGGTTSSDHPSPRDGTSVVELQR